MSIGRHASQWEYAGRVRRQFSNLLGLACPSRCTSRRSTSFFTSASSTRRTTLRSDDHRCSTHLLRSPEMEYLDCAKSKATAPSSITTAFRDPTRKSSTVLTRVSGFTFRILAGEYLFVCDE